MADIFFIRSLGVMVVGATVFVLIGRIARVPAIVAYILAGLALGPVLGLLQVPEAVEIISEVGIILLLFLVGLELSLDKIRVVGRVAVIAGLGQVVFTAVGGFGLSFALGFTAIESLFLAVALTFSSTVVIVKLLTEKHELDTVYGRIAVGIFLVQDLIVILILTFLAGLGGEDLDLATTSLGLVTAFGGMALLLLIALVTARYVLPRLFGWVSSSMDALFIWSLSWCFLLVVGAEVLHLSIEIGAFIAGLSLAQLPYSQELRRRVHPLMNFFIAVFFAALGVRMDLDAALDMWLPVLVLSLFVLFGKSIISIVLISRLGYAERVSFLTGVTVAQISEFSFIVAAAGLSAGLIDESILSVVALIGLVTIAISAYLILYNHPLYERLRSRPILRVFRMRREEYVPDAAPGLTGHIIVVGLNSLGQSLVEELSRRGETVLAVDTDPQKLARLDCFSLLGNVDHPSVLEDANLAAAKLVVSALQIEDTNNLLAYRCREHGVPCSIHAFDRSVVAELRAIGVNHLMIPKNNGIKRVLAELNRFGVAKS